MCDQLSFIYLLFNLVLVMSFQEFALYEAIVYGILLVVGGIIGFTKANSKPSLFLGTGTGVAAILFSFMGLNRDPMLAFFLLAAESMLLSTFFYMRYSVSKKFMPGGLMMAISIASFSMYCIGICIA